MELDLSSLALPGPTAAPATAPPAPTDRAPREPSSPPERASARLALARSARRSGDALRARLFAGGLPELLLPISRLLVAREGEELAAALAAARADAGGKPDGHPDGDPDGEPRAFDWSAVDWSADDPFAACNAAAESAPPPAGLACERRALAALASLLRRRLAAMGDADGEAAGRAGERDARRAAAAVYVEGQRRLLEAAEKEVLRRIDGLPAAESDRPASGSGASKRKRAE